MIRSTSLCLTLILVAACSNAPAPTTAPETLAPVIEQAPSTKMGHWNWLGAVGPAPVSAADPARYTVEFQDGGTALIRADCNRGQANYDDAAAGTPLFGPIGLTKMGCSADSQDRRFLSDLRAASAAIADNGWLRLPTDDGLSHAILARDPGARLRHYQCTASMRFALATGSDGALLWIDGEFHTLSPGQGDSEGSYRGGRFEVLGGDSSSTLLIDGKMLAGCQPLS